MLEEVLGNSISIYSSLSRLTMSGGLFLQQILMQHLVGFVVPHIELLFWMRVNGLARQAEESNDAWET